MSNNRNRSSANMPPHMAAANIGIGNTSREDKSHGKDRGPRIPMNVGDYNLQYPEHLMKPDKAYHWFADDNKGRLQRAKDAWWDHVPDEQGVNYSVNSGGTTMYLMAIDKIYYDEDNALREKNYRASIGETEDESLKGLETYVPSGSDNKIKVTSDPFA